MKENKPSNTIGLAKDWNLWHETSAPKYPHEKVIQFCLRNYPPSVRADIRVLDLGCGNGVNTLFMLKEGFQVEGVDFSATAVESANRLISENGFNPNLQTLAIDQLESHESKFELIICIGVLDSAGIEASAKSLKTLPHLMVSQAKGLFIFASDQDYRIGSDDLPRIHGYSVKEVHEIFASNFSSVKYDRYITTYENGTYQQNDWIITIGK